MVVAVFAMITKRYYEHEYLMVNYNLLPFEKKTLIAKQKVIVAHAYNTRKRNNKNGSASVNTL